MLKNKENTVQLMSIAFQTKNKEMALASGMSEEDVNKFVETSTPSIMGMLDAVYDKLAESDLLVKE